MQLLRLLSALSLSLAQDQEVLHPNGYQAVASLLGETTSNQLVKEVWNELWAKKPQVVKELKEFLREDSPKPLWSQEKLSSLTEGWRVASSEEFPDHIVRLKDPTKLGVDSVKQWSGYVDNLDEDKHFFFWLFESRGDPATDPVILWLNGGPGCSSTTGQLFELGPSNILKGPGLEYNPYSWNSNATVIFLDQPVNVGFSWSSRRVRDSYASAEDVYVFLNLLFEELPEYTGKEFHISGESYAGHYLPTIGAEIVRHPERNFNLTSVLIGNGITDTLNQVNGTVNMICGNGGYPSVVPPAKCDELYSKVPRAMELIEACYDTESFLVCSAAGIYADQLYEPYFETYLNPYDIRDKCGDTEEGCYPETGYIEEYLNLPEVKNATGGEVENFVGCSDSVGLDFVFTSDGNLPVVDSVIEILEAGVPVLLYEGDKDTVCPWTGNLDWSNAMPYYAHKGFEKQPLHPWRVKGKAVGETKTAGGLTYLRVFDAGHMVPHDQPSVALEMLHQWIGGHLH